MNRMKRLCSVLAVWLMLLTAAMPGATVAAQTATTVATTECTPAAGWATCRELAEPKITIMGAATVTPAALDLVSQVYADMTSRLTAAYPKSTLDGLTIYLTNAGDWAEVGQLAPIGTLYPDDPATGISQGDEFRGGSTGDYVWLDEQLICKTGVETRNAAIAAGQRSGEPDTTARTVDQAVQLFAYTLAQRYGLQPDIETRFNSRDDATPLVEFGFAVQGKFGVPIVEWGAATPEQQAYINGLFGADLGSFSCDAYTAALTGAPVATVPADTAAAPAPAGDTTCLDAEEQAFVTLLNQYRAEQGLPPVQVSATLTLAADRHSRDMGENNYFSHYSLDGREPADRSLAAGYQFVGHHENIFGGGPNPTAADAFNGWKNSPGHHKQLVNPKLIAIGIARVEATNADLDWYWTNTFGETMDAPAVNCS